MPDTLPISIIAQDAPLRTVASNYPSPFAERMAGRQKRPLGNVFGLHNFGVNLTRLPPGCVSSLRHAHSQQDEFVYILEGSATLVTDEGATVIGPGCCAGFAAGTGKAHQLVNHSVEDVVFLEVGDRSSGDEVSYPDDDIVALLDAAGKWRFHHKDGTPY